MEDFDELWNTYAIEFNDKLENANNGDWSKLDEYEQEIAALWKLAADVYSRYAEYPSSHTSSTHSPSCRKTA